MAACTTASPRNEQDDFKDGHGAARGLIAAITWCTERTALAPSPTAAATRFMDPARTSPMAKTPGMEVSKGNGRRP